ncbi:MAG: hypothetical protein EP350_02010, partial [Alphaproteobacteria bacterium]
MTLRQLLTIASLFALTACTGSNAPREEGGAGEAEGEVLGGSISDEMLPLDALKSQSPPLKASPSAAGDEEVAEEGEESQGDEAGADAPA